MENFFVPRVDEYPANKSKFNRKKPLPEHQCEVYDSYGDDYEEYNPFHQRGVRMPAIIASEGTSKALKLSQPRNNSFRKPSFPNHKFKTKSIMKHISNEVKDKNSNITIKIKSRVSDNSSSSISITNDSKSSPKRSSENIIKDIRSTQSKRKLESAASDKKIEQILQQVEDHARQWIGEGLIKQENSTLKPMPSFVSEISFASPDKINSFSRNSVLPDIKTSREPVVEKNKKVIKENNKKSDSIKKKEEIRSEVEEILQLIKDDKKVSKELTYSLDSAEDKQICITGENKKKCEKSFKKKKKNKLSKFEKSLSSAKKSPQAKLKICKTYC